MYVKNWWTLTCVYTHMQTHTHHYSHTEGFEGLNPAITRGTHLPYSPLTPWGKPWALSVGYKDLWMQAQVNWKISTRVPQGNLVMNTCCCLQMEQPALQTKPEHTALSYLSKVHSYCSHFWTTSAAALMPPSKQQFIPALLISQCDKEEGEERLDCLVAHLNAESEPNSLQENCSTYRYQFWYLWIYMVPQETCRDQTFAYAQSSALPHQKILPHAIPLIWTGLKQRKRILSPFPLPHNRAFSSSLETGKNKLKTWLS